MRPVFPSLAALAWNEPRRKAYWEAELINALKIVDRGWSTPEEMRGSWAGAMGHTHWMPEVWLNVGMDYDKDGQSRRSANPTTRWAPPRTIWSTAASIAAANIGAMRSRERRGLERQPHLCGMDQRGSVARRRPAVPATKCHRRRCGCRSPVGPAFLLGPISIR